MSYQFIDEQDLTSDGRVWALDTGFATFRLYQTGTSRPAGFVGTFDANCDRFGCATPI